VSWRLVRPALGVGNPFCTVNGCFLVAVRFLVAVLEFSSDQRREPAQIQQAERYRCDRSQSRSDDDREPGTPVPGSRAQFNQESRSDDGRCFRRTQHDASPPIVAPRLPCHRLPNLGLAPEAITQSRSATKPTIMPSCNRGAMTTDSLGRQSQVLATNSTFSRGATTAVASDVHSMTRHHPSSLRDSLATAYPTRAGARGYHPKSLRDKADDPSVSQSRRRCE
jgi:hypothetical protein